MVKRETCYKRQQKHHTSYNILDYTMYRLVEAETHQSIYQISYATNHNRMKQKKYNLVYLFRSFCN